MKKVKGRLLAEKRKVEKLKERAKQKEEEIESVKKWRKQRGKVGLPVVVTKTVK